MMIKLCRKQPDSLIPVLSGKTDEWLQSLKEINYIRVFPLIHLLFKYFKMKTFRSLLVVASIIVMGMISCSKGSTGPAGPAGPAGPDSVVYSAWIPLALTYVPADTLFEQTLTAPSITKGILDSGVILSYVNVLESNGTYHVIPTVGFLGINLFEDFSVGKINIASVNDFSTLPYRYVTIPGSQKAKTNASETKIKGYTIQELRAMPYEQVIQVLADKN
jgi:hypothetical protein